VPKQETVLDFILSFLTPCSPYLTPLATGSLKLSLLSSPHPEASPAMTFHACYSLGPTRVKPQPAPAIHSQESVHTTLSNTHHTRKRPSTGPRTTNEPHKVKNSTPSLFPIANNLNPYLLFMYLFQGVKASMSEVAPACSKVTNLTPFFPIANDLNPHLLFLFLFQRAK
jgi:hypothetical protein